MNISIPKKVNNPLIHNDDYDAHSLGLTLLQHIEGQLERADTKAQFTLTIDALLLATSTVWSSNLSQFSLASLTSTIDSVLIILALTIFLLLAMSTMYSIRAVMPKLNPPKKVNNLFYFGTITQSNEHTFIKLIKDYSHKEVTGMLYSEVYALSAIAKRKYELIRRSYFLLLFAISLWTFAQVLAIF